MRNRTIALAVSCLGAAGVVTGGTASAATTSHAVVRIKDIEFKPHVLTVSRGTRVTWKFLDPATSHNVTSKRFASSPTRRSGTYSVTFTKSGTYRYRCTIHPGMKARVVVR